MPGSPTAVLLTTSEVAAYLRIKERTIYDMVARGQIPFSRVSGKLLFPRRLVDAWIEGQTELPDTRLAPAPLICSGSSEPLLEWALRQSGAGLAILTSGSRQGLEDLAAGRAMLAGTHLIEPETGRYNIDAVRSILPFPDIVMIHWARRVQGLLVARGNPSEITSLRDVVERGLRVVLRSEGAGSQILLDLLLAREGLSPSALNAAPRVAESHGDMASMIEMGEADCGLGLAATSLGFLPLWPGEEFDLVMRRRDFFEPPVQKLLAFAQGEACRRRAEFLGGYDLGRLGEVRFNA
ncbi:helix-turn-helix transcriptional regulator [Falsigemmobacter faecalis]|uniref:Helix-turn-helix domain-containing protein n=1 Tax=Falsigemmobacter faecalis TaxID=2488730 RepID=A0A3P3DVK0_9RHOB|nr:helix-turn-helix transcriptional regulator [Falsigemmobacter faecalis]RRH78199.1 helix-turn-helix domain-containing protein [Falsigemmobacter faecalis]